MFNLYERISSLCEEKGISVAKMCGETGISRGNITELKKGRIKSLSSANIQKIADYFEVSIDYLLGSSDIRKVLSPEEESTLNKHLQELHELTKDFTQEQFDLLIQHAQLLEAARHTKDNH